MKITSRGWFVLGVVSTLLIGGLLYAMGHLYWVGDGYCWGSFESCY